MRIMRERDVELGILKVLLKEQEVDTRELRDKFAAQEKYNISFERILAAANRLAEEQVVQYRDDHDDCGMIRYYRVDRERAQNKVDEIERAKDRARFGNDDLGGLSPA